MDIRTYYRLKPVPSRSFDWEAVDYATLDYDSPAGYGATEEEAIADLLEQLADLHECIDCGEVNPRGHMQGACYMNCSKGAAQ